MLPLRDIIRLGCAQLPCKTEKVNPLKRQFILFASFFLLTVVSFQVTLYFMSLGERPQRKTIIAAPKITKSVPKLAKKIDAAPRPIKKELTGSELARQAEELWNDQTADPQLFSRRNIKNWLARPVRDGSSPREAWACSHCAI